MNITSEEMKDKVKISSEEKHMKENRERVGTYTRGALMGREEKNCKGFMS
jgi:hypothetical protein